MLIQTGFSFWKKATLDGRVLDADSGRPVAGAVVIANWGGTAAGVAAGRHVCAHADAAVSDAQGAFHMPNWDDYESFLYDHDRSFRVYKFGYELVGEKDLTITLRALPANAEHWRIVQPCHVDQDTKALIASFRQTRPHFYGLYNAIVADLTPLADTPLRQQVIARMHATAESCLVDYTKPITIDPFGLDANVDPRDRLPPPPAR